MRARSAAILFGLLFAPAAVAQLDPGAAATERLGNGLTLIVLEEHSLPSASVQMLYRVGARDEPYGLTGIAHFLEHMAFRATKHFPDTEVMSRIYAAGGEWRGYTWIDQTTYFATVPREALDLLLRIEADRMAALELDPALVEPERGAVLAEMHGYENDPASVLHDAVVFAALQAHPYRNNTIGWESDVRALTHADLLAFYRRHYVPANAVLAVVGDVDREQVKARVSELFGAIPAASPTPLPRTVEPRQSGERRVELIGAGSEAQVEIAWQAPGVGDADFAAFLLLQEWLGGGSGVNFMQNTGTSPVRAGTLLADLAADARTWFPPAAQTYLFSVSASVPPSAEPAGVEAAIEAAVARLRDGPAEPQRLDALRDRVLAELTFDVETHEDAAHQLAFFDGLGAPGLLQSLPAQVAALDARAVQSAAQRWLTPQQRTIGWYRAGARPSASQPNVRAAAPPADALSQPRARSGPPGGIDAPIVTRLPGGLPLIVQRSGLSPAVHVRLVLDSSAVAGDAALALDDPVWGVASLAARCRPGELAATLERLRAVYGGLEADPPGTLPAEDPAARLEQAYREMLGLAGHAPGRSVAAATVVAIVVAGAVDAAAVEDEVARWFGDLGLRNPAATPALVAPAADLRIELPLDRAQAQIGYAVPAPLPAASEFWAWRALLYVLTHGYEGRLGREAIGRRGLAYYVDGQYRSDGRQAWIAITTGVDPEKLAGLEALYRAELARLVAEPPTEAEVAEARAHFLGRLRTARQSNEELTAGLAEEWTWHGRIAAPDEQRAAIERIGRTAVLSALDGFLGGRVAVVAVGKSPGLVTD